MLTFDNRTFDDLLARIGQEAIREAEEADIESFDTALCLEKAREIVEKHEPRLPGPDESHAWVDYVEIKFGSRPRVEIKFIVPLEHDSGFLTTYQDSREFSVPLTVGGDRWVFTYSVDYDFDPQETKAVFRQDLDSAKGYVHGLEAREKAWAQELTADLAVRLRKRRAQLEPVATRIEAMGYPAADLRAGSRPSL
jgi:hypothetical protein